MSSMDNCMPRCPGLIKSKSWTLESIVLDDDDANTDTPSSTVPTSDTHPKRENDMSGNEKQNRAENNVPGFQLSNTNLDRNCHETIFDIIEGQDAEVIVTLEFIIERLCAKQLLSTLGDKQRHSLVGKIIREMIKNGSIVGLSLPRTEGEKRCHIEYFYKINPRFRRREFNTTAILCLEKTNMTFLRVFESIQECVDQLGLVYDRVLKVCRGLQGNSRGLVFEWWTPEDKHRTPQSFNDCDDAVSVAEILRVYLTSTSRPSPHTEISSAVMTSGVVRYRSNAERTEVKEEGVCGAEDKEDKEDAGRSSKRARKAPRPIDDEYAKPAGGRARAAGVLPTGLRRGVGRTTPSTSSRVSAHGIFFKGGDGALSSSSATAFASDVSCTLLICDGCEAEHFLNRLGLTAVPAGDWFCDACRRDGRGVTDMPGVSGGETSAAKRGGSDDVGGDHTNGNDQLDNNNNSHSIVFLTSGVYKKARSLNSISDCDGASASRHHGIAGFGKQLSAPSVSNKGSNVEANYGCEDAALNNVNVASVFTAIQVLGNADHEVSCVPRPSRVTFRAICRKLHPHLFAATDRSTDPAVQFDEALALAIIASLDQLLYTGQVQEHVGGVKTAGENFRPQGRRRRTNVPPPTAPLVRTWPPTVRFYDDDNNLDLDCADGGAERVPPERRKTYSVNPAYHDSEAATAAKLSIRVISVRSTWLRGFSTALECASYFQVGEPLLLQCCNGVWQASTTPWGEPLTAERELPTEVYDQDYPLLRTSSLARRVLQLVEVLCAERECQEVDAEDVYASLLTEFASQKHYPVHIEDALDTLHRRGFITLPPPGIEPNDKASARLRPLPRYRMNPHHRPDLLSAAVLCLNLQEEPLHIFKNLADIAHKIHLRPENVLKVCLKSNTHDELSQDGNKWPKSHSNLIFKWADEMSHEEEAELAGLCLEDEKLDSWRFGGRADPVDRIRRSLEAGSRPQDDRGGGGGDSTATPSPLEKPRVVSKRAHVPSLKIIEQQRDEYDHATMASRVAQPSSSERTRATRNFSPAAKGEGSPRAQEKEQEAWDEVLPLPHMRRSVSISSQYDDERSDSLEKVLPDSAHGGSGSGQPSSSNGEVATRVYSSSLRAYCERHAIAEECLQLDVPDLVPAPPATTTISAMDCGLACRSRPVSYPLPSLTHQSPRLDRHHSLGAHPVSSVTPRLPHHSSPVALPFDHLLAAHKRKWSLSPQDLQCFANSSPTAAVLRTWDDAISFDTHPYAGAGAEVGTEAGAVTALEMFMERAKKLLCGVGNVFRAKLFNQETKTFDSKVVVVVSTNGDTTHFTDAYRLKVFSGSLPLHTISLKECPFEGEDDLWGCWCKYGTGGYGCGADGVSLMDAMKSCVQRVQDRAASRRWYAGQVECVLPWLLKRHARSTIFLTAEPNLIRALRALQATHPAKTMPELVRLYFLISDHRSRAEVREKERKDQYRCVLRVFMCADFLLGSEQSSEDDISEWLCIYSAFNFTDLFS